VTSEDNSYDVFESRSSLEPDDLDLVSTRWMGSGDNHPAIGELGKSALGINALLRTGGS
jgi:hypothetical protein